MGSNNYSETAPYNCPKSNKIFENGCEILSQNALKGVDIPQLINGLALLSSGDKKYHAQLGEFAKKVPAWLTPEIWNWEYAHGVLFLSEYILATGDTSLLPDLKRITTTCAQRQLMNGLWGHSGPHRDGRSPGYGGMNMIGVPMTIGLVLAKEAGVNDPTLDGAIKRSVNFLRGYNGKGALPYGDHLPSISHDDNGKTSAAAILFDLLGERDTATFYACMGAAAYDDREQGHTGNFFNILWALPGVARLGPIATGAYMKEQAWYYDLARTWKGEFVYQQGTDEYNKYTEWNMTGTYLLSLGLERKGLYITGKKAGVVPQLNATQVKGIIDAGRDYHPEPGKRTFENRTPDQLITGLSSWSPWVRAKSAEELGKRPDSTIKPILPLLTGTNRYGVYGACEAIKALGGKADEALPGLLTQLKNTKDPWAQCQASLAIAHLKPEIRKKASDDLLKLMVQENPNDPGHILQRYICMSIFSPFPGRSWPTVYAGNFEGVDRKLLIPALQAALLNEDGAARSTLVGLFKDKAKKLTEQDVAAVLPTLIKAIETMPPTNEMWADDIRLIGLDLLSSLKIREGMALCVSTIEYRWGNKAKPRMDYLMRYGTHAKEVLPLLKAKIDEKEKKSPELVTAYEEIQKLTDTPPIITLKEFQEQAKKSQK